MLLKHNVMFETSVRRRTEHFTAMPAEGEGNAPASDSALASDLAQATKPTTNLIPAVDPDTVLATDSAADSELAPAEGSMKTPNSVAAAANLASATDPGPITNSPSALDSAAVATVSAASDPTSVPELGQIPEQTIVLPPAPATSLPDSPAIPLKFDEDELKTIRDLFHLYDRDGDGYIGYTDMSRVLCDISKYEPTKDTVEGTIQAMIPHHEGSRVDFASFLWYQLHKKNRMKKEADEHCMLEAFLHLDRTTQDGFLCSKDLQQLFNDIDVPRTQTQIAETLRETDKDGDGKISYTDFVSTMTDFTPHGMQANFTTGLSTDHCARFI